LEWQLLSYQDRIFRKGFSLQTFLKSSKETSFAIRISTKISYTKDDSEAVIRPNNSSETVQEFSLEERAFIFIDLACSELYSTFIGLHLALSIAHPGAIYFWECWIFSCAQFVSGQHGVMTSFDSARTRAEELKWPEYTL
jgi:hypothetical protein